MPNDISRKGDLARELKKLTEHRSWPVLKALWAEEKERLVRATARAMFSGNETLKEVDQRMIDYRRGYLRGVDDVLNAPDRAVLMFEKAVETEEKRGTGRV